MTRSRFPKILAPTALLALPTMGGLALASFALMSPASVGTALAQPHDSEMTACERINYRGTIYGKWSKTLRLQPGDMITAWPVEMAQPVNSGNTPKEPLAVVKVRYGHHHDSNHQIVMSRNFYNFGDIDDKFTAHAPTHSNGNSNSASSSSSSSSSSHDGIRVKIGVWARGYGVDLHCESMELNRGADALVSLLGLTPWNIYNRHFGGIGTNGTAGQGSAFLTGLAQGASTPSGTAQDSLALAQGIVPMTVRDTGRGMSFDLNLTDMMVNMNSAPGLAASGGMDGEKVASPLRVTLTGDYVSFNDDQSGADRDGDTWRVALAASHPFRNMGRLGGFVTVEEGEVSSAALAGKLQRNGFGFGVFGQLSLPGDVQARVQTSYTFASNDITVFGASGEFDSERFEAQANLSKGFTSGQIWGDVAGNLAYIYDDRDGYTDSVGTPISGGDQNLISLGGNARLGLDIDNPRLGKAVTGARPYVKVGVDWDFENEGNFAASSTTVFQTADVRWNVGGGADVALVKGASLSADGAYFASDTELEGWSFHGALNIPIGSLPGMHSFAGSGGLMSLTAGQETLSERSLMFEVNLPLN